MNISDAFSNVFEKNIERKMMYYSYAFPYDDVIKHIDEMLDIPINEYVNYIYSNIPIEEIEPKDVFQFSSLENGTIGICKAFKANENRGFSAFETGELLFDDEKERKKGAIVKYGENHVKTAELLGLVFKLANQYYLSAIGMVFDLLEDEKQKRLMTRLVLRNKLVQQIIIAQRGTKLFLRLFLYNLAESVYKRRTPNIKCILQLLKESEEFNFSEIINNIVYDHLPSDEIPNVSVWDKQIEFEKYKIKRFYSLYVLGKKEYENGNYKSAADLFLKSAEPILPQCQHNLSIAGSLDRNQENYDFVSDPIFLKWARIGAISCNPDSLYNYGVYLLNYKNDKKGAMPLFVKAAENHNYDAMILLGKIYLKDSTTLEKEKILKWLAEAVKNGKTEGKEIIKKINMK